MGELIELILNRYELFLLVFVRATGIFIISPFFSSQNIPNTIKIGLAASISIILTIVMPDYVSPEGQLIIIIIKELMVGYILGYIAYAFFSAFYVMGQIVDMKIGFGMVNVIDPQNKIQVPLMGNFYYILAFLMMLAFDGHHSIIRALVDSYSFIPINGFNYNEEIVNFLINSLAKSFEIGFKLSTPVVAVIFLTDLVLGIISKTIPQMNVFVVGMPLKVLIGLFLILISMTVFLSVASNIFGIITNDLYHFLKI